MPGFDPSILRHSGIWGATDEAVLNIEHKKNPSKFPIDTHDGASAKFSINSQETDNSVGTHREDGAWIFVSIYITRFIFMYRRKKSHVQMNGPLRPVLYSKKDASRDLAIK